MSSLEPLAKNAWWCAYCDNRRENTCLAGVPWFCSSRDCAYFAESVCDEPLPAKLDLKKVLVDTL